MEKGPHLGIKELSLVIRPRFYLVHWCGLYELVAVQSASLLHLILTSSRSNTLNHPLEELSIFSRCMLTLITYTEQIKEAAVAQAFRKRVAQDKIYLSCTKKVVIVVFNKDPGLFLRMMLQSCVEDIEKEQQWPSLETHQTQTLSM